MVVEKFRSIEDGQVVCIRPTHGVVRHNLLTAGNGRLYWLENLWGLTLVRIFLSVETTRQELSGFVEHSIQSSMVPWIPSRGSGRGNVHQRLIIISIIIEVRIRNP